MLLSADKSKVVKTLISEKFGMEIVSDTDRRSVLFSCEPYFDLIMKTVHPGSKVIIEIGTANGCSALYLSQYADHVYTFDVTECKVKYDLWLEFGVTDKITSFVVKDSEAVEKLSQSIDYDLVFIDGDHSYEGVAKDIQIFKKCGRLIFHDVGNPGIRMAIDDLVEAGGGSIVCSNKYFMYWVNKETVV